MSWTDLQPYTAGGGARSGVMLSASKADGRFRPVTMIVLRPRLWGGDAPEWLRKGHRCAVQVGTGDHRGQLRIVPGGAFAIGGIAREDGAIRLSLPLLPGQKPGKQYAVPCEFEFRDDWIEIELPAWAKPAPAAPQPALSPEAAKKWGAGKGAAA